MRIWSAVVFWALAASSALAGPMVPDGFCTVVLSSRPSLSAALDDVRDRWAQRDITIYKASNGWFAVTSQIIPAATGAQVLARDKAAGRIPQDAICSSGNSYVQRVTRLAASSAARGDISDTANAAALSSDDQRYTQLGLAFQGHYNGLLDGKWGRLSQRALDSYAAAEFSTAPENWQLAALAFDTFSLIEQDGWAMFHNDWLQMSYLFPMTAGREGSHTDIFTNWEHRGNSLRYSFARTPVERASAIHTYVSEADSTAAGPYTVRRDNFAVTRATAADGNLLYARSRYVGGYWSTVLISAQRADAKIFGAVTSSIVDGYSPAIVITQGGALNTYITETIALLEQEDDTDAHEPEQVATATAPAQTGVPDLRGTGSGFIVTAKGSVLTNAHVVEGCSSITAGGMPAKIVETSDTFDLALLTVETDKELAFARFAAAPAPLNSDVTVMGYPLSQDLGGLNVTRGAISAAKGLGGDAVNMQITAPIQPGNSGGPVIDRNGAIVGVVVSKLDEQKYVASRGITPQNVNFAIRGEIAKLFLFQNDVSPALQEGMEVIDPVDLARQGSAYTVLVECR